jgi:hypothetical protein
MYVPLYCISRVRVHVGILTPAQFVPPARHKACFLVCQIMRRCVGEAVKKFQGSRYHTVNMRTVVVQNAKVKEKSRNLSFS